MVSSTPKAARVEVRELTSIYRTSAPSSSLLISLFNGDLNDCSSGVLGIVRIPANELEGGIDSFPDIEWPHRCHTGVRP